MALSAAADPFGCRAAVRQKGRNFEPLGFRKVLSGKAADRGVCLAVRGTRRDGAPDRRPRQGLRRVVLR